MRPRNAILLVAGCQLLGAILFLLACGIFLYEEVYLYHWTSQLLRNLATAVDIFFIILPLTFALVSLAVSFGLLFFREWARKATLVLSILPVLGVAVLVLFQPTPVFPQSGIGYEIYVILLVLLAPLSIWWLLAMTSPTVRYQFNGTATPVERARDVRPGWFWVALVLGALVVLVALIVGLKNYG